MNLCVSVAVKRGLLAVIVVKDGIMVDKYVEKIKDEVVSSSVFTSLLYAIKVALLRVRAYISNNNSAESITIEINNSTVKKWIYNCFSKDEYQDAFIDMMSLLQQLPIRYSFVVSDKPRALMFANERNITKTLAMSGLRI